MNSLKSSITVLFLLFVSYGVYRVIHTPDPIGASSGQFLVGDTKPTEPKIPPAATTLAPPPLAVPAPNMSPNAAPADSLTRGPLQLIEPTQQTVPPATPGPLGSSMPPLPTPPSAHALAGGNSAVAPGANSGNSLIPVQSATNGAVFQQANNIESGTAPATVPAPGGAAITPSGAAANPAGLSPLGASPNAANQLIPALPNPAAGIPPAAAAAATAPAWEVARQTAVDLVQKEQMVDALRQLSSMYHAPLDPSHRAELLTWLDALASRVVYSTENCFSPTPYVVQPGETLETVAAKWKVPPQLVANVNRAKLPANGTFVAGLELKQIPGPFHAEIDLTRRELTLFLGDMYAGRFPINPPADVALAPGRFQVGQPQRDEASGQVMFLEIGQGMTLAGTANALPNSLVLSDADAQDVFGILSADSQVTIRR